MATRTQQAKVGAFLLGSAVLIIAGVLTMQGINRESTSPYYIRFEESVLGLGVGGLVEYRGVPVGTVKNIYVADDNTARVEIEIIDSKVTVRKGVRAQLVMLSFATGQMAISLQGGEDGEPLESGSDIPTVYSTFTSFSSQFETLLEDLGTVVGNLSIATEGMQQGQFAEIVEKVDILLDDSHTFMESAQGIVETLDDGMGEAVDEYTALAKDMRSLAEDVQRVANTADEFLVKATEKIEPLDLEKAQGDIDHALAKFAEMADSLNETVARIDHVASALVHESDNIEHSLGEGIASISEAFESVRALADSLNEDPASLVRGRGRPRQ